MKSKHLLSITDLSPEEIAGLIKSGLYFKNSPFGSNLSNKSAALIFEKPSLRTKVSFDVAVNQLGGHSIYLSKDEIGLGTREPISDVARVLSRLVDIIILRTFSQGKLKDLAAYSHIPVINALSDEEHPCQALADMLTIHERFGTFQNINIAYIGDGNNVASSLALAAASLGSNFIIACPPKYSIPKNISNEINRKARKSGSSFSITSNIIEAVSKADVVYTDTWISMGQEEESNHRLNLFSGFQVNEDLLSQTGSSTIFMHPLPAHTGQEISQDLLEHPKSVVFDQAENRLHIQKAILAEIVR
jgi:ornithine carbamoyltransferase|tara:strand:+ start:622 stop:1533 length:912 start_codon:yes stop_codon:yes gene_type:complete